MSRALLTFRWTELIRFGVSPTGFTDEVEPALRNNSFDDALTLHIAIALNHVVNSSFPDWIMDAWNRYRRYTPTLDGLRMRQRVETRSRAYSN
ncbi:MAG TPA: hypothetical protein VKT80_05260, partial [Chloroflexota bacterium]|nr:hypothetical protein [Chloroflexota bacterium]